ncbi:hypothetical protein TNCV_4474081 [Trichonephila clavipes]|nr:hypothetical protein TNCV_4474081 [Trichonephila clavipes]
MDDNATIHRVRNVQNWFVEPQPDFQHFPWPQHSPDFKPIENAWDLAERSIRQYSPLPSSLKNLKSCTANEWHFLEANAFQKHVDSKTKRIRAVMDTKDGLIKY